MSPLFVTGVPVAGRARQPAENPAGWVPKPRPAEPTVAAPTTSKSRGPVVPWWPVTKSGDTVDTVSHAAWEVVDAFGVNYDDCFGEVYTRHGAPAFFPRLKIIMEVCSKFKCGLLQTNSHSNAILNAFIASNGSRSDHLTTSFNCQYNRSQMHCAMQRLMSCQHNISVTAPDHVG